jgi:hypothetical protein
MFLLIIVLRRSRDLTIADCGNFRSVIYSAKLQEIAAERRCLDRHVMQNTVPAVNPVYAVAFVKTQQLPVMGGVPI